MPVWPRRVPHLQQSDQKYLEHPPTRRAPQQPGGKVTQRTQHSGPGPAEEAAYQIDNPNVSQCKAAKQPAAPGDLGQNAGMATNPYMNPTTKEQARATNNGLPGPPTEGVTPGDNPHGQGRPTHASPGCRGGGTGLTQ